MKSRIFLLLAVIILHVAVAKKNRARHSLNEVSSSVKSFSHKFVQAVVEDSAKNLVSSPLSVYMVLAMLTYGARQEMEKKLRSVLGLPKGDSTERGIQSLVDEFSKYKEVDIRLANSIFLDDTFQPKTAFMNVTKTVFRSEAQIVDFSNSVEARNTINQWCENKTDNLIKDLISPDGLSNRSLLVLVNAVYFKGKWSTEFKRRDTKKRPFHLNNGEIKNVKTMHSTRYLRYGELPNVDARFVALPYKEGKHNDPVSMLIILPNKVNGLIRLVENFRKVNIADAFKSSKIKVDLHLPKFRIESTIDLEDTIVKLDLAGIFKGGANFSGIVDDRPITVSKAKQKAFIEVDEGGSTAAAATYIVLSVGAPGPGYEKPPPMDFDVNRPFLSVIATRSGQPLFVSVVNDPAQRRN